MTNKHLLSLATGTAYTLTGVDADADFSPSADTIMHCTQVKPILV